MGFPSNATDLPFDYLDHTRPTNASSMGAELNLPYTVCEILVAICAVFGNGLVIIVFGKERKLRRRTNYYIVSLATADLLVGLFAIPFAILASIGLPKNLHACLFTVSVLVVLCTISIFCLVAVSVDRYWAILYPMGYSRTVRTKTAIGEAPPFVPINVIIVFVVDVALNSGEMDDHRCIFTNVMDYDYLVFLYFATIIFPALLIAAFYAHIYRVIVKQLQQIVTMDPSSGGGGTVRRLGVLRLGGRLSGNHHQTTGTMLRCLGAARKREVKATQNLSRIVVFFIVCWFPLYTINCVMAFCPRCEVDDFFMKFCIILSHINSVGNPLLYAYHLKDFRIALKNFVWRLLFPHSDVKSSVISVIHDRGSLVGSQRQLQRRFSGFDQPRSQRPSLLRQVIDNNRRLDSTYSERRVSLIQQKETHQNITDISITVGSAILMSNSAPMNKRMIEKELASDGDIVDRADDATDHGISSSMELQTYKSLAPLLPAEEDRIEETPPASIFVIEADVVNHASPDHLLVVEESRDRIDVAGG
ncbi:PREDICTED: adenosine receptor A2b-like [Acromyrmex echinatior]|uniref:Adenosine receptor A2b n=1 Tax=Acromyrmex echinatior TaxID=103372 RepID=F4W643_ACREC|nr:PREDICTED: adenosine receptor A2b-like [Acromyrmex echinatior]EGI70178.1 Adenosine receptor A2b [Acromyrmex echinatior]